MKRFLSPLKYISGILLIMFFACDDDYATVETDIEGITNFNTDSIKFPVVSFNRKLGPVQTNNLSSNLMGIYNDPIYGQTTGSVVTQIVPTSFGFNFPEDIAVDSVILTIPYYAKNIGADAEGTPLYELDSLFGDEPVSLTIYQNNYFLRDFDPDSNLSEAQKYYSNSNQTINFDNFIGELLYENDEFLPNDQQIVINDEETIAPSLRVHLNNGNEFWDNLFFFNTPNAGSQPEISNQNNFKDYFRGLYFKIEEAMTGNGHMMMMNFSQGNVIVYYSWVIETTIDENGDPLEIKDDSFIRMNFTGNRLNILENDPTNTVIADADANADPIDGDQSLYLKGGEGSMAVIDLFNGTFEDPETGTGVPALEYFKSKKDSWLINEANLTLYVDQNQVNGEEPNRVMLIDLENNVPIVDYFFDGTTNNANPSLSKSFYSKILERDSNDEGVKYKFRLTEHLNNILLRDSTNVKLGVYVSTNVNEIQQATALEYDDTDTHSGSVMSPRGTVLYGSNSNVPDNKKVKFELYYTEPDK
ncbi:DUF4270 domain-containing protein [Hanstruepera flava]|uniref:DUF4270 domain-containing protein n=1 Tax=Hanstruepera flava TaxID=2930218 RepID=UPI002028AA17|nr:DUF4270 domain-containing protein [Hanstruepera flava]